MTKTKKPSYLLVGGFFMKQKTKEDLREAIRLIGIERKLGKEVITQEEVEFVKVLADDKKYPRAEYVMAVMLLNGQEMPKDKDTAMNYLERSSEHASYDIQLKIAYVYHVIGEYKKIKLALERALADSIWF